MKWRMVIYLGFLLLLSSLMLRAPERLLNGIFVIALTMFFDLAWKKIQKNTWSFPLCAMISGLIVALIMIPSPPPWFLIFAPLLITASKHLLRFPGKRHIFNPAAFSLFVLSFFLPSVSWWSVSWGNIPLIIIIAAGLFILSRLRKFPDVLTFFATYIVLYSIFLIFASWNNPAFSPNFIRAFFAALFDPTVLFFATVMLIEPITSNVMSFRNRLFYVGSVAFFALFLGLPFIFPFLIRFSLDLLITGLVLGNLFGYILYLRSFNQKSA